MSHPSTSFHANARNMWTLGVSTRSPRLASAHQPADQPWAHLRDGDFASGLDSARLGFNAFATFSPCRDLSTFVESCVFKPAPPVRFSAPLATSPVEVRCSWVFQFPAPSVLEFSQLFDGLLLLPANSSFFIRAPLLGFKVQRAMNGVPCRNCSRVPQRFI